MTAQRRFYVAGVVGSIILICLLMWQISEAAAYPPEIQERIGGAAKISCEIQTPRKVGMIAYLKHGEKWLIRIFTKDGQELEIWFNESASHFSLLFGMTDKIYFYENGQWFDQDILPEKESRRLDRRLKFTGEEKKILKACVKTALETMGQKEQ